MAKGNLINKKIWAEYSKKGQDSVNNPKNMGEITQEQDDEMDCKLSVADFGADSCGDAVR